ncbi:MAG: alpha/beta fold hydrolase [Paracoccaceae bacterium]
MSWHPHPNWSFPGKLFRYGSSDTGPTVLLTHGTFSNIDTLTPLAAFLDAQGMRVFGIEWRDRGGRPGGFTYDDIADLEISEAIRTIAGSQGLHLIGHSGGGLALILGLHLNPDLRPMIRSLTSLATQATHLHQSSWRFRTGLRLMRVFGRLTGYWTVRVSRLGPCNESAALQAQWLDWNHAGRMTDPSGNDVFAGLKDWKLPVMAVAAPLDTDIAPRDGCQTLAKAFGKTGQFHIATRESDGEDFTHSRLIRSRGAARVLWPRIAEFILTQDKLNTRSEQP